jgi:hypothetical protein
MNFAARMESTGLPGRIQVSSSTADELRAKGKAHWVEPRLQLVSIKGKGTLQTYWASPGMRLSTTVSSTGSASYDTSLDHLSSSGCLDKDLAEAGCQDTKRLVEWNVEVLMNLLEYIVRSRSDHSEIKMTSTLRAAETQILSTNAQKIVADEITQILSMPQFDSQTVLQRQIGAVKIPEKVEAQLYEYVSMIASLYRDVPFHNFDHASHVIMSAGKLMKRLMTPERVDYNQKDKVSIARDVHKSTYGISSDPIMLFAVVFSALIHDVGTPVLFCMH